jgi:hypothetical protein
MADGTVVEFAGDPELEHRIAYLAENLFVPQRLANEPAEAAEPGETAEPAGPASAETPGFPLRPAEAEPGAQPETAQRTFDDSADIWGPFDGTAAALEMHAPLWPQVRLVFADGSEAALPRDQEIVDRVSYVIENLLPARRLA